MTLQATDWKPATQGPITMAEIEIPDDVREAAEKAHAEFADSRVTDNLSVIIARAILSERERCAKVAEDYGDGGTEYDMEPEAAVATSVASKFIAASIRSGAKP